MSACLAARLWPWPQNFETVLLPELVTQMLAPSKAIPRGKGPTGKVETFATL